MAINALLWPVLAQVALTLAMFVKLALVKARAIRVDGFMRRDAAVHKDRWPAYVLQVSNNIANQFETPVLFYVLALALSQKSEASLAALVLAWVFVALRVAHAIVHTGSNDLTMRLRLFTLSVASLFALLGYALWQFASLS